MAIRRRSLKSVSILPVPRTTEASGSSAIETGKTGFFANAAVKILDQRAPAGEYNTAIADIGAEFRRRPLERDADRVQYGRDADPRASRISLSSMVIVLGTPSMRLRPLTSIVAGRSSG